MGEDRTVESMDVPVLPAAGPGQYRTRVPCPCLFFGAMGMPSGQCPTVFQVCVLLWEGMIWPIMFNKTGSL